MRFLMAAVLLAGGGVTATLLLTDRGSVEARASAARSAISPPPPPEVEVVSSLPLLPSETARPARRPIVSPPSPFLGTATEAGPAPAPPPPSGRAVPRSERRELAKTRPTPALVEDLRDDEVRWNATAAAEELHERLRDPRESRAAGQELERALHADDAQQVRLAAGLLRAFSMDGSVGGEAHVPSDKLLDLTADELDGWDCWINPRWIRDEGNDDERAAFALANLDRMEERLVRKLSSPAPAQRFIHAYLLAKGGRRHVVDLVAPVLIDHLRDNYQRDDALMSMEALHALGDAVLPWLQDARPGVDPQQRDCLELLFLEITAPAVTAEERAARAALNRVTWKCDDPVQSWRYLESPVR